MHRNSWVDLDNRKQNDNVEYKLNSKQELGEGESIASNIGLLSLAPDSASSDGTQSSAFSSISALKSDSKNDDLRSWLNSVKLGSYYGQLLAQDITFDILPYVKKEDVNQVIPKVGDRIRLWKAICELPLLSSNFDRPVSGAYSHLSSNSSSSEFTNPLSVKFYSLDNKAIHLEIRTTGPIQSAVFHTAKLPTDGSYVLDDGFDHYEDDDSLRDAIFKRNIREFWIKPSDWNSEINSEGIGSTQSDEADGTLTLSQARLIEVNKFERPTSIEVAKRISEFFPTNKPDRLAQGLRNSIVINRRLSTISGNRQSSLRISRRISAPPSADSVLSALHGAASSTIRNKLESQLRPIEHLEHDSQFLEKLDSEDMSPSEWLRGKLIGSGSFGSVYLAFNVFSGDILAVKQVQLMHRDQKHQKMVEAMHQEIRMLRELEHENIVQYRGFKNEGEYLNIFLEYIAGGSLATKIATYGALKEDTVKKYTRQCLSGLGYLHERGIIHRDIKGANILVDTDDRVKISDFGLSKHEDAAKQRYSMQGTAFWMAPEVARAREKTTTKADIWSLGCLIIELVTGMHPFPKLQAFQAIYKIGKGTTPDIPENVSPELRDLLSKCLDIDPNQRPTAQELLKHPFFGDK